jgi:hypothetical protein
MRVAALVPESAASLAASRRQFVPSTLRATKN